MLSGKCDCIEARRSQTGAVLPEDDGFYQLYPIEYKHGRVRQEKEYEIQLCAQAICLEEMYHTTIPEGALFYIDAHQRVPVVLTQDLRKLTIQTAKRLWECFQEQSLPAAEKSPKCRKCSLLDECMPMLNHSAHTYCRGLLLELQEGE